MAKCGRVQNEANMGSTYLVRRVADAGRRMRRSESRRLAVCCCRADGVSPGGEGASEGAVSGGGGSDGGSVAMGVGIGG